jgi:hypothetical protein
MHDLTPDHCITLATSGALVQLEKVLPTEESVLG